MKIDRILIHGLRCFVAFEHAIDDDWLGEPPAALLVTGLNGSGKSTLLDVIAGLWGDLASWLEGKRHSSRGTQSLFKDCRLAAIRLTAPFPGDAQPLWLFVAKANEFVDLTNRVGDDGFIGVVDHGKNRWIIETSDPGKTKHLAGLRDESISGGRSDVPNVVYVSAEERRLKRLATPLTIGPDEPANHWLAEYGQRQALAATLRRFESQFPQRFADLKEDVNRFLEAKRFVGTGNGQLLVELEASGVTHDIFALSTGERQALLLLGYAHCWLHRGGLLLVDEPDLYMHNSWVEQIANALSRLAAEREGQFIFTSHSPLLWENYAREAQRIRLGIQVLEETTSNAVAVR